MSYASDYLDIYARTRMGQAQEQGAALRARGAGFANALGQIGQTVAQIPQQIQESKDSEQNRRLRQAQIDKYKSDVDKETAETNKNRILANAYKFALNPDGTVDRQKLTSELVKTPYGDAIPDIMKSLDATEKANYDLKQAREQGELAYAKTIGSQMVAAQFNPDVVNGLLEVAKSHQHDVTPFETMWKTQPEQFKSFVSNLVQPPKQAEAFTLNPGDTRFGPDGKPIASVAPKPEAPPSLESKNVMLNGQQASVNFNPKTGQYFLPGTNEDVSAKVKPVPSQTVVNINNAARAANAPIVDVTALRPDPKTANRPDMKLGGLTPNSVYQAGIAHALQGVMPSLGLGSSPATQAKRDAIINKASAMADAAGTDFATLRSEYKANSAALSRLVPLATMTAAAAGGANDNLQLALDQSAKVPRTGSPIVNTFKQWLQTGDKALSSNPEIAKLQLYVYTAAREYAKVTSGSAASVQGLTDAASRAVDHLLSSSQSPETFAGVAEAMQKDMNVYTANQMKQIKNVSSTIANFLSVATGVKVPGGDDKQPTAEELIKKYGRVGGPGGGG